MVGAKVPFLKKKEKAPRYIHWNAVVISQEGGIIKHIFISKKREGERKGKKPFAISFAENF